MLCHQIQAAVERNSQKQLMKVTTLALYPVMYYNTNRWPAQGGAKPATTILDWRCEFQNESRQEIVKKLVETLKVYFPIAGQKTIQEFENIAAGFEERTYAAATSYLDYLTKLSVNMLAMDSYAKNNVTNSLPSNAGGSSKNPADAGTVMYYNNLLSAERAAQLDMDILNWGVILQYGSRQRIVNYMIDTLKRYFPFAGEEEIQELRRIAIRIEEKTYDAYTSQCDYLRKISLVMLTLEQKFCQNNLADQPSSSGGSSRNPIDAVRLMDSSYQNDIAFANSPPNVEVETVVKYPPGFTFTNSLGAEEAGTASLMDKIKESGGKIKEVSALLGECEGGAFEGELTSGKKRKATQMEMEKRKGKGKGQ